MTSFILLAALMCGPADPAENTTPICAPPPARCLACSSAAEPVRDARTAVKRHVCEALALLPLAPQPAWCAAHGQDAARPTNGS